MSTPASLGLADYALYVDVYIYICTCICMLCISIIYVSLGLADFSQVDMLGLRFKSVILEREGARAKQIDEP